MVSYLLVFSPLGYLSRWPFSPHLFIICAKGLSSMIQYNKRQGLFSGLHFNADCPLFLTFSFIDDNILFCKANIQQVKIIKKVLQYYVYMSIQEINFQKSVVFFDKSTPLTLQNSVSFVLGITTTGDYGTYLGFSCLIGRSKKHIFQFVKCRIWKKLYGWKGKSFISSRSRKLIKNIV